MKARYYPLFVTFLACASAPAAAPPRTPTGSALPPVAAPVHSADPAVPVVAKSKAPVIKRISSSDPTCGVDTEGRVWQWQRGEMERDDDAKDIVGAVAVECGMDHSCAIMPDGAALCWGGNGLGALGDGTDKSRDKPVRVVGIDKVAETSLDFDRSCARSQKGDIYCWGDSEFGKAGDGRMPDNVGREKLLPGVPILSGATSLAVAEAHACSVMNDGKISCWGQNNSASCGQPLRTRYVPRPKLVPNVKDAAAVATGASVTCMIDHAGAVSCWGMGGDGILGPKGPTDGGPRDVPQPIPLPDRAAEVSVGDNANACARLVNGAVYCWGHGEYGVLGDGTAENRSTPVQAKGITHVKQITAGLQVACALVEEGRVFCWGKEMIVDHNGGLGDDANMPVEMPVAPSGN